MINTIQQDTDLWEVWIEYDPFHPEYFGTLYVHGEIPADKNSSFSLIKIDAKGKSQLCLQIPTGLSDTNHSKEVLYSEPVRNLNQYASVCIFEGDEQVGCFKEIEIMI